MFCKFLTSLHARSPQRVARTGQIALSPAFCALDTHDLRRGLHFWLTLFVPPSAFKENLESGGMFFIRISPVKVFILTLAYLQYTCMLTLGYLHCFLPPCIDIRHHRVKSSWPPWQDDAVLCPSSVRPLIPWHVLPRSPCSPSCLGELCQWNPPHRACGDPRGPGVTDRREHAR